MSPDFSVLWKKSAAKELRVLDPSVRLRVLSAVVTLGSDPFPQGVRKLQGSMHTFRLRVGDYRVIYQVNEQKHEITITRVRHRREVYRG